MVKMRAQFTIQWIIAISIVLCCKNANGSRVSLTVEGGGNDLVGPHCPGTVRLVCDGVDLTFLEWKYNDKNEEFVRFLTVHTTEVIPLDENPAFVSVQLTEPPQCSGDLCNFSSVLTADMLQLREQNINKISCGALESIATIAVNVTLLQPFSSTTLNITNVTAYYSEEVLNSVKMYWDKLVPHCKAYESIVYDVTLSGSESVHINRTSCGEVMCMALITTTQPLDEYHITLMATEVTSSDSIVAMYYTEIASHSDQYFLTEINTTSCHTTIQCISAEEQSGDELCVIQYTTGKMSKPSTVIAPSSDVITLPQLTSDSDFEFSVIYGDLTIMNSLTVKYSPQNIVPDAPDITNIQAFYSNSRGELKILQVEWVNLASCNNFSGDIVYNYTVEVRSQDSTFTSESEECMMYTCTGKVVLVTSSFSTITLALIASNNAGISTSEYTDQTIYQSSASFYRPSTTLINCTTLQMGCLVPTITEHNTRCIIQYYGGDSQYRHLISTKATDVNADGVILNLGQVITSHHFTISLNISATLEIKEEFAYFTHRFCSQGVTAVEDITTDQEDDSTSASGYIIRLSTEAIIGISVGLSVLLCCVCTVFVLIVTAFKCRRRKKSINRSCTSTEDKDLRKSPSPLYEEIPESLFHDIDVAKNDAYNRYGDASTTEPIYYNQTCSQYTPWPQSIQSRHIN